MNKQEIYEHVCSVTAALKEIGIAKKLFDAAKSGEIDCVTSVIDNFKQQHVQIYSKCVAFGKEIDVWSEIFDINTNESYVFDPEIIDPLSFCALTVFGKFDDSLLFEDWDIITGISAGNYIDGIDEAGYEYLSQFVCNASILEYIGDEFETLEEALVAICTGVCKDWF